ncbi:MAG: RND family efflux transporter MFP subunit [Candidatus Azotimanducaceae bacterium]
MNRVRIQTFMLVACATSFGVPVFSAQTDYPAVDCVVQPHEVIDLGSPVAGLIREILVAESDHVSKGQPVALIDDSVEQATVELARARAKVDIQLEIEKTNNSYDKKSQQRINSLYGRQVISVDNKDAADREAKLSNLRLLQVEDLQVVRNRELQRAHELVKQKTIRSTIDGFVIKKYKSHGEFVEDQPILRIARLDPLNVEALVPMKFFGLIKVGMIAEVSPEFAGGALHSAQVTIVDRIGDAASGTFGVRLEMDNPDFKIPAGLKCEVKFLETSEEILAAAKTKRLTKAKQNHSTSPLGDAESSDLTYAIGPFEREDAFFDARDAVSYLPFTERREAVDETQYYMVIGDSKSRSMILRSVQEDLLEDYRELKDPPHRGQFSLGVYSTQERAERRVAQLESLKIRSQIAERKVTKTLWWIDVIVSDGNELHVRRLIKEGFPVTPITPSSDS